VDHPGFVTTMKVVSAIGSWWTYTLLFAGSSAWLLLRRQRRLALFIAVAPLTGSRLNGLAKWVVDRPRPFVPDPVAHAGGLSFTSGHAQSAAMAALVMLVVLLPSLDRRGRRVAAGAATAWVFAVGFSRVALGVHYVSDVLAGYALGVAWVVIAAAALLWRAQPRTNRRSLWREPPPVGPPPGT
jgi:undecaprenyl-diphosphatase